MTTVLLLQLAGLTHLGLIAAGVLMPRVTGLHEHLRPLPPFVRRLMWVYYAFIGLCLVSFGALSFFGAEALAGGTPLARGVCAFLCAFWTLRLVAAACVLDVSPYLTSAWRRAGYWATNVVFTALPLVYGWAAWAP